MEKVLIAFAAALAIGLTALATGWAQSKLVPLVQAQLQKNQN